MRSIGLQRQIAELLHDQELRLGEAHQSVLQPALAVGLGHGSEQRRRGDALDSVAAEDCFPAECNGQVRLADARRGSASKSKLLRTEKCASFSAMSLHL